MRDTNDTIIAAWLSGLCLGFLAGVVFSLIVRSL